MEPIPYDVTNKRQAGIGSAWTIGGAYPDYWGPAAVALNALAGHFGSVMALQVSVGGSILDAQDSPTSGRGSWNSVVGNIPGGVPQLYPALVERVVSAQAFFYRLQIPFRVHGLLWHQGESDHLKAGAAAVYESNWTQFVGALRVALGMPSLPIYYGTISAASTSYNLTIRNAQLGVAAGDAFMVCRDNDGLTFMDNVHWDGPGAIVFGEWLANQVIGI